MSEGQHSAQVKVKASVVGDKQMRELAKTNFALNKEITDLHDKLIRADGASRKVVASTERLTGAQRQAAAAARAQAAANKTNADALAAASISGAQKQADAARRAREALESTGKASLTQRLAAIKTEENARLQQVAVEMRSAKSIADSYRLQNKQQQIQHDAHMQRLRAQQSAAKSSNPLSGLPGMGGLGGLAGMAGGAVAAAVAVDQLSQKTLAYQNVAANLPFSIDKAREATRGLISDYDLMQQALTANRLGIAKNSEDFAAMANTATKLGVSIGRDATDSLNDFVNGLGRGSTEVLDNLGVTLRAEEAHKLYAKSVGKTVGELTELEKRQSVVTLGLERGAEAANKVTLQTEGVSAAIQKLKTDLINGAYAVLNLDNALSDLATETLKTFGLNAYQAAKATEMLGQVAGATARVGAGVLTLGLSEAGIALYDYATSADQAASATKRGVQGISELSKFLQENKTWAERAGAALDSFGNSIYQMNQNRAVALQGLRDLEDKHRSDQEHKRREFEKKEEKEQDRKDAAAAKKAADARKKAYAFQVAEREFDVAEVKRQVEQTQRAYDRKRASYSDLLKIVEKLHERERELSELQIDAAVDRSEKVRAYTESLDQELAQRHELLSLAEAQLAIEREAALTKREALRAENELAVVSLGRQQQLRGSAPRVAAPGRQTLAQGLGIEAVGGQSQASSDLAFEVSQNEERRALRQAQLDEERQYQQELVVLSRGTYDGKAELAAIAAETDQLNHDRSMDLLRQRELAEQEALQREIERQQVRRQTIQAAADFGLSQAERGLKTAISTFKKEREARSQAESEARKAGKSRGEIERAGANASKRARGESLISLGEELQGEAIAYGFKALAALITLNFVGAGKNAAAGAIMGGAAAAVKARGNSLISSAGSGGGGGGGSGSVGIPSAGGGGGAVGSGVGAGTGAAPIPGTQSEVPPSPPPNSQGSSSGSQSSKSSSAAGGSSNRSVTVNINGGMVDDRTVRQIRDTMDRFISEG